MNALLNVFYFILGGWLIGLLYFFGGLVLCLTIIGIPMGVQCFKLGLANMAPIGREVRYKETEPSGCNILLNVLWVLFAGIELFFAHLGLGCALCLTIIGIPLGIQHFKLMILAFAPFGKELE